MSLFGFGFRDGIYAKEGTILLKLFDTLVVVMKKVFEKNPVKTNSRLQNINMQIYPVCKE